MRSAETRFVKRIKLIWRGWNRSVDARKHNTFHLTSLSRTVCEAMTTKCSTCPATRSEPISAVHSTRALHFRRSPECRNSGFSLFSHLFALSGPPSRHWRGKKIIPPTDNNTSGTRPDGRTLFGRQIHARAQSGLFERRRWDYFHGGTSVGRLENGRRSEQVAEGSRRSEGSGRRTATSRQPFARGPFAISRVWKFSFSNPITGPIAGWPVMREPISGSPYLGSL